MITRTHRGPLVSRIYQAGGLPPEKEIIVPSEKLRILLITSSFPGKGRLAGLFLPDLILELNKLGCEVWVLTQNCDSNHTESDILWDGCRITYFGWRGKGAPLINVFERGLSSFFLMAHFLLSGFRAGHRISRQWHPHFLFAEWLVPAGLISYGISKVTGIPYAVRGLGSDVLVAARNPVIRKFVQWVTRGAALLFADGFDLCQRTSELAGGRECHFAATSRRMGDRRSGFSPLEDAGLFTTLTVGRLHPAKGQDILIEAARILQRKGFKFRSYIVGEGENEDDLREQVQEYGLRNEVILAGRIEDGDLVDLLGHIDCVVIPSRSETIPLVLQEAVEAKRALIVTDVGDMRYLVEKYHLGYTVPKEDPEALAEAIERMSRAEDRWRFTQEGEKLLSVLSVEKAAQTIHSHFIKYLGVRD